jgi:phosphopantothenoylcysteine decarboxylase/phosphopantothenate--cysteine ligase
MFEAVKAGLGACDVFISVAAVADYRVTNASQQKMKKGSERMATLALEENPDILAWVAARPEPPFCVGFAAETEKLAEHAAAKRAKKKLPLLAANLAQEALGADENEITLFDDRGAHTLGRAPKIELARKLILHIAGMLAGGKKK